MSASSMCGVCWLMYMGFKTTQVGPFHISESGVEERQAGASGAKCTVALRGRHRILRRSRLLNARIGMFAQL